MKVGGLGASNQTWDTTDCFARMCLRLRGSNVRDGTRGKQCIPRDFPKP